MFKCATFGIVLLAIVWPAMAAEQTTPKADSAVLRTTTGLRFELPPGWVITKFDGELADLAHSGTMSGEKGKEKTPNYFYVNGRTQEPDDSFDKNWEQLDRDSERSFPGGVTARWKAGMKFSNYHYGFFGELRVGSKILHVSRLDGKTQTFDLNIMEAAFLHIAETLSEVPATEVLYHPALRIAATQLKFPPWQSRVDDRSILFLCNPSADECGEGSNTWIDAYPTSKQFPNVQQALADITGFFEKNSNLKIGKTKHLKFPGGEASWTEQPGSNYPFLGAILRDGRTYFVQLRGNKVQKRSNETLRRDFLAVVRSVRAWDGK